MGLFTPVLQFGGGTTGITYSTQEGVTFNMGLTVYFSLYIVLTSKGTDVGNATITGLDHTNLVRTSGNTMMCHNVNGTVNYTYFGSIIVPSATTFDLNEMGPGQALINLTDTSFNNDSEVYITGMYWEA